MLLGLIQPTGGGATVLGEHPGSEGSLLRTGAMIETPAFYPHLSGRDNLKVLAMYTGAPKSRIDVVLGQVDLLDRAGDAFSDYSLGMKQRLGVAAALLKDPALLILDEPTNGLDPAGMAEMRDLIRDLGHGDRTVLLSSHLMHEVEQICDRVGVIAKGRLVAEGTVDDLRGEDALIVGADPIDDALEIVNGVAGVGNVTLRAGALRITAGPDAAIDAGWLNTRLVTAGISVHELRREQASLESVFLDLTGSAPNHHDRQPAGDDVFTREVAHVG
jgi:ABC-2 type transport system ATP-binding protein